MVSGNRSGAFERLIGALRNHGSTVNETGGDRAVAQCPAHDDGRPSLSIGPRDDGKGIVVFCHAGCDYTAVLAALKQTARDLFNDTRMRSAFDAQTTYLYDDGRKVHRKPDKTFPQSGNTKDRSLYRVERIGDADTVYVPEGEKDVQVLEAVGAVAVCSAMGAGKARFADWTPLAERNVVIVADNDEPGFKHAREVAALLDGVAATVQIVKAAVGKDAADHVAAGRTLAEFVPVAAATAQGGGGQAAGPPRLEDAHIGAFIADDYLRGDYLHNRVFGWMHWDGRRWAEVEEPAVAEVIRLAVIDYYGREATAGADVKRLVALSGLLSAHRMRSIMAIAKGRLHAEAALFDVPRPELLNVRNGVIDLRDGSLTPHDRDLMLTKVTMVDYMPDATHPDWTAALTALDDETADWLQLRLGQGLTGVPAPDDVLVVLQGSGDNGKTTIVDGVRAAAGPDYGVTLPDRVLLARTGDHPTELMTLRGARIAVMEEFPELGHLNVKRLKDLHGTGQISARYCGRDTVYWAPTHSIFVTTNYLPRVDESDHGTWRRLALVEFPYRYRKAHEPIETARDRRGDGGLRSRIRAGHDKQHEAALAWLVTGAVRWYQGGGQMPEPPAAVRAATQTWHKSADLLLRFTDDELVFDPTEHVMSSDLYEHFTTWLKAHGHKVWTDQSFTARFGQHPRVTANDVQKKQVRQTVQQRLSRPTLPWWQNSFEPPPARYWAWLGVRFRHPGDDRAQTP